MQTCVVSRRFYYTNFHWNRFIIFIVIAQLPRKNVCRVSHSKTKSCLIWSFIHWTVRKTVIVSTLMKTLAHALFATLTLSRLQFLDFLDFWSSSLKKVTTSASTQSTGVRFHLLAHKLQAHRWVHGDRCNQVVARTFVTKCNQVVARGHYSAMRRSQHVHCLRVRELY